MCFSFFLSSAWKRSLYLNVSAPSFVFRQKTSISTRYYHKVCFVVSQRVFCALCFSMVLCTLGFVCLLKTHLQQVLWVKTKTQFQKIHSCSFLCFRCEFGPNSVCCKRLSCFSSVYVCYVNRRRKSLALRMHQFRTLQSKFVQSEIYLGVLY